MKDGDAKLTIILSIPIPGIRDFRAAWDSGYKDSLIELAEIVKATLILPPAPRIEEELEHY